MKLLVIIMIFISYGYFCDGQGRRKRRSMEDETNVPDYESSSSSSSSTRRIKTKEEGRRNRGIIRETTKRILQYAEDLQNYYIQYNDENNDYYADEDNVDADVDSITKKLESLDISTINIKFYDNAWQLKNIKKTNLCIKYTGYQYLTKLLINENITGGIIILFKQYISTIMDTTQIIHVSDTTFPKYFKTFLSILNQIVETLLLTKYEGIDKMFRELNHLALDLILDCEVPISYFLQFASKYITPLMKNHFQQWNLTMSEDALLNIWMVFLIPEQKGSSSCIHTRLLVLLVVFKRTFPFTNFNTKWIQAMSDPSNLCVTKQSPEWYIDKWSFLNKLTMEIIEGSYQLKKHMMLEHNSTIKNIIVYLIHSFLNCGVPKQYIFRKKGQKGYSVVSYLREKFLPDNEKDDWNIKFFRTYTPGTLGCFTASIDDLFNQLSEMNNACEKQLNIFTANMADAFSKCNPNLNSEMYLQCKINFENVAIQSLLDFDKCLFSITDNNTASMNSYIAITDKFALFQNVYQICEITETLDELQTLVFLRL